MSDEVIIKQSYGLGGSGNPIGIQNNYGLSVTDAIRMAFALFKEYYPQLREEALDTLKKLITERLNNIPQDNIIPPKPRIAIPVLQNASITDEIEVREMYANLLANSMNKVVRNGVHPGFVEIIKQLSPDEAKILKYISQHQIIPTITLRYMKKDGSGIDIIKDFSNVGEIVGCENEIDVAKYFDNLSRLGLVIRSGGLSSLTDKALYEPLKTHKLIAHQAIKDKAIERGFERIKFNEGFVRISSYGESFCDICIAPKIVIKSHIKL